MAENKIPICPIMSAGNEIHQVCMQERCALYMKNVRSCSFYVIAHAELSHVTKHQ